MVPFCLSFSSWFPCTVSSPRKGTLIIIWLLGYQVLTSEALLAFSKLGSLLAAPCLFRVFALPCAMAANVNSTRMQMFELMQVACCGRFDPSLDRLH